MSAFLLESQPLHTSEQTRSNTESRASFMLESLEMDLTSRDGRSSPPNLRSIPLQDCEPNGPRELREEEDALAIREVDGVRQGIFADPHPAHKEAGA